VTARSICETASVEPGISVIVCCYNSARRLPETLAHLSRQAGAPAWELIVVDNASTDNTAQVAGDCWKSQAVPLRIVHVPTPGLIHARMAGLRASRYEWISFVDDDNWLCADWLATVADIFSCHSDVGACGGWAEAVFEAEPPRWWSDTRAGWFAVGPQADETGPVPDWRGFLYGAGLSLRRCALDELFSLGFRSFLEGRTGAALSTGEDVEWCLALRLRGWTLWYDARLRLRHFLPERRLQWTYLRGLQRAVGAASIWLDAYRTFDGTHPSAWKVRLRRSWLWQFRRAAWRICRWSRFGWQNRNRQLEGDERELDFAFLCGRFAALLRTMFTYDRAVHSLETAAWRRSGATDRPLALRARTDVT
jgi:glycosyltransferase involved in cell wall biosynthesis